MMPLWFLILGALLSLVTVAGNGIVVYFIVSERRLHRPTNWIVLSLALADLSVGGSSVLLKHMLEATMLSHNEHYSIMSFLYASSTSNLCLLTLDRYIFITKPLRYVPIVTTRRVLLAICSVWLAVFWFHFLCYIICIKLPPSENDRCVEIFATVDFVLIETLPMLIMAYAVGNIIHIVWKKTRETKIRLKQLGFNHSSRNAAAAPAQRERSSTVRIIGVAVLMFTICFLSELSYTVLHQITAKRHNRRFQYANNLLYLVNSAINPIAYALFKRDIKKAIKKKFCYGKGKAK